MPFISLLVALAAAQMTDTSPNAVPEVPPVLLSIATCESGQRQYDDNGNIVQHFNADGTYDSGYFQINSRHKKQALGLGYDVFTPEGNIGYALWLYNASGTIPWNSSKKCWSRMRDI